MSVICTTLVAGGYYVMTSVEPLDVSPPPPSEGCSLATSETGDGESDLEPDQAANAATISGVAFQEGMPQESVTIAYATVWQESEFHNLEYGDRDSVGLFQQRPSQEWGDPEQLTDPIYASTAFYEKLSEVEDYQSMPVYEAAQAVQRSADGYAYDQHEERSRTMASAFTGAEGAAVSCWFGKETPTGGDTAEAREEMRRVFGTDPSSLTGDEENQTGDLGWAMASWAVANAHEYGITSVTYGDQRWSAETGQDGWSKAETPAPEGEILLG